MSRPRSSSDPSADNKQQAPMAPSLAGGGKGVRTEIANWGKKSSTGYVGLSNQGATCYLNSLLQCLYMTPEFRHSLFTWRYKPPPDAKFDFDFLQQPDDDADADQANKETTLGNILYDAPPEHSIPFQLQCLFARLHKSCRGACSTKPLTKSFHWDDGQAFQQHDVQELLRVLFDAVSRALSRVGKGDLLNNLCKGTLSLQNPCKICVHFFVRWLHQTTYCMTRNNTGTLLDYLDCQQCHSDRSREDIFLDLSLTIEHIGSLEDAIKGFIEPEIMSEGNQVNCNQCDKKQDFKKGLKFKKLPPLLIIQLKRFHYDWQLDRRVKLSHKVSFPKSLDMTPYIDQDVVFGAELSEEQKEKEKENLQYSLYGVIIQSGGALGGHYFANIKSFEDEKWYRFNDSSVRVLEDKEFDDAFGGESVRGTGYVLLYRQSNLKLPENYGFFPKYLTKMIEKEDEAIKKQWEIWQKDMRTITVYVHYPDAPPRKSEAETDEKKQEEQDDDVKDDNPISKYDQSGTEVTLKLDVEEWTFAELLKLVRKAFDINDEAIPIQNTRLRKYHDEFDFVAEGYDDENIQQSKIEIAKWPKRGLHLMLETKKNVNEKFAFFNPNDMMIKLFVVEDQNTADLVDRGFVQAATFKQQDLPPGGQCSVIVDSTAPLSKIQPILFDALKSSNIVPNEWLTDFDGDISKFDVAQLHLLKFDYNKIRLFCDENDTLSNFGIKLGTLLYIEKKSKDPIMPSDDTEEEKKEDSTKLADIPVLSPSYQRSKLAVLYEEQRLKISVQYNEPLPSKSVQDRLEELLMTPQMLATKKQSAENLLSEKKRLEFTHAVRISKECTLQQLKTRISKELNLEMNGFRLRKSTTSPELRDMDQTLNAAGITDGGLVYVEFGVPTGPKQTCITFSLYDPNKFLTDPHKKKKTLAQKLFEYPFNRDIKVSAMKLEIVNVVNQLFPLYRGKYNFPEAIKLLKKEEQEQNDKEIDDLKKATELSKNGDSASSQQKAETETKTTEKLEVAESKTETESASDIEANDDEVSAKRMNIFGIEHVRLRKQRGAKVMEMFFDDQTLTSQIVGKKDALQVVVEKIPIKEHFTKNHLCFWLQQYRPDQGKAWSGKVSKKKEFVIDKRSKMIDLKRLMASLLKKSNEQKYHAMTEDEIVKNVSITKGFSATPMTSANITRVHWPHRNAMYNVGVDPDRYLYKLDQVEIRETPKSAETESEKTDGNEQNKENKAETNVVVDTMEQKIPENAEEEKKDEQAASTQSYSGQQYTDEQLLEVMQNALAAENEEVIGRPPFHLRNGDLIVWTDITWRPTETQIKEKQKLEQEKAMKGGVQSKKKKEYKGSTLLSKFRKEPESLKIRTYEEYLEDERKKKEEEEKRKLEREKILKEKGITAEEAASKEEAEKKPLTDKHRQFNAMVAESVDDIQNPKPRGRTGSF